MVVVIGIQWVEVSTQGARLLREDMSTVTVLALDPEGYVLSASGASRMGYGHGEDIVHQHISRLYPANEAASGEPAHALAAAAADGTYAHSGWRVRADGSRFWADTVATATRDADGRLAGFCVVVRDLTGHWQHLERLRAVGEINQAILAGVSSEEVLTLIVQRVREAVDAGVARVMSLDWGDVLTVRAADGIAVPAPRSLPPYPESVLDYDVIRAGRAKVFSGTDPTSPEYRSWLRDVGLAAVLSTPLTVRGRTVGVLEVANRRGGRSFSPDDLQAVGLFTESAGLAVQQARSEEDLRRLACTADVGRASLRGTLDALATSAVVRTDGRSCAVYLLEPGPTLWLAGGHDRDAASAGGPSGLFQAVPGTLVREAIAAAAPVIRTESEGGAVAGLPLLCRGEAIGALCCSYPADRRPGDADIAFLQAIAEQTASTVENDRLWAAARETAALEERQRLSRELHDSVSQALYGIALGARTARELLDRDVAQAAEPIDYVRRLADTGLAEMRAVLNRLRPESLETDGLGATLARHVDALRAQYGIAAEAVLEAEPETTLEAKHALCRIAQEALHNVAKHARARHVLLQLLIGPGSVTLVIDDDGVGFDPRASFPGHLGLRSMRERAREVGGTLQVDSHPGEGSRIRATVPTTAAGPGASGESRAIADNRGRPR
ncbi:GAF domain-containing protein [Streptomyces gobiensis]|uniref:GAF domain-containing protein n=1 Tax=Streptomyces gobiensis TaxID=2875706 RepID=UPI001E2DD7BE|nr:GAF domain-containing protein [Streptomyces gobiensis]UGY90960.1 histidine kinase [Streptomyces gobiensis]